MVIPTGSTSLSGLGCDCSEIDNDGNCLDPDPCSSSTGATTGTLTLPGFSTLPIVQTPTQAGETVVPSATPTSPTAVASTGMTAQQYALYSQILNNAGTLGKELAITPGTVVTPQGAVSQQNPGYPIGGTGFSSVLGGVSSSSIMPLALLAIGAIVILQMGRR